MSWPRRTRSVVAIGAALERLASLHPAALAGAGPTRTAGATAERSHPDVRLDRGRADDADLKREHYCGADPRVQTNLIALALAAVIGAGALAARVVQREKPCLEHLLRGHWWSAYEQTHSSPPAAA